MATTHDIIYFVPVLTETTTIHRIREFRDCGLRPVVLGFDRQRFNRDNRPDCPQHVLGRTVDGHYFRRLFAVLAAIVECIRLREPLGSARIYYARNIDLLMLALVARTLLGADVAIAYEVLDIQPVFTANSLFAVLLRWVERRCLERIDILIVSSPAFYENYYAGVQDYRGRWYLLENKLHRAVLDGETDPAEKKPTLIPFKANRWRVGYFGLIRGQATLDLIARLAGRLRERVHFRFCGVLTTVEKARFAEIVAANENVTYGGAYENPRDLPALYDDVDFAWAIDLENTHSNSRWLLPCRFYEAGLFGVPCLAMDGFEIGKRIRRLDAGWCFAEPLEDALVHFFETLTRAGYERTRRRVDRLPRSTFVAGSEVVDLCRILDDIARRRHEPRSTARIVRRAQPDARRFANRADPSSLRRKKEFSG